MIRIAPMRRINIGFKIQFLFKLKTRDLVSIWRRAWLPYLPNSLWIQCGRSLEARPLQLKHVFMLNFVEALQPNNCFCICISGVHFFREGLHAKRICENADIATIVSKNYELFVDIHQFGGGGFLKVFFLQNHTFFSKYLTIFQKFHRLLENLPLI